jgi:hypothetical protein
LNCDQQTPSDGRSDGLLWLAGMIRFRHSGVRFPAAGRLHVAGDSVTMFPILGRPAQSLRPVATATLLALLLLAPSRASAGVLDWIFPQHDVQAITVTDTTPAGKLRRTPTAKDPVYYIAVDMGYRDFGGVIAGDKVPAKTEVRAAIVKALSQQHYLPAAKDHPTSLLLLWTWGTMNPQTLPSFSPNLPDPQINRQQLLRFLGGYKLGLVAKDPLLDDTVPGTVFHTAAMDEIDELSKEDLYIACIGAYDYAAAVRKENVLLWTTKISSPARGLTMAGSLPTMLALAAPYIGRETDMPVSVSATDHFKPDVKLGDAKVVEYLENTPLPIVDAEKLPESKPSKPVRPKK